MQYLTTVTIIQLVPRYGTCDYARHVPGIHSELLYPVFKAFSYHDNRCKSVFQNHSPEVIHSVW